MKIEHVAFWVKDLENMKSFYETYFNAVSNPKYINPVKKFESYFLSFENGARLEIMFRPDITEANDHHRSEKLGMIHLAFSTGSREGVDILTEKLRNDGFKIVGEPRTTGDGYYESVILDPENNLIEITE